MSARDEQMNSAAAWFARMRSDARTLDDEAAFERWLAEDPENERHYLELQLLWGDVERFRDEPLIAAARRSARAESRRSAGIVGWAAGWRMPRIAAAASAAALLIAVTLLAFSPAMFNDATYKTAMGDRETVRLADGSEIVLNTDSLMRVRYRPWTREIALERGQAYFKVAHSALRPFDVRASGTRIRAIGTAFDVFVAGEVVKVTLVEGHVEVTDSRTPVATAELKVGESLDARPEGLSPIRMANVQKTTAWIQSRLIFENERLQDAVAEVNRYSPTRLVVLDDALAELRVSGVFQAGGAQSFVDALRASFDIEARRAPDGTLILVR